MDWVEDLAVFTAAVGVSVFGGPRILRGKDDVKNRLAEHAADIKAQAEKEHPELATKKATKGA